MALAINVGYRCTSDNIMAFRSLSQRIIQSGRARFPMINGKDVFCWGSQVITTSDKYPNSMREKRMYCCCFVLFQGLPPFINIHRSALKLNPHTPNARRQ